MRTLASAPVAPPPRPAARCEAVGPIKEGHCPRRSAPIFQQAWRLFRVICRKWEGPGHRRAQPRAVALGIFAASEARTTV
jgi:hypothetical protein